MNAEYAYNILDVLQTMQDAAKQMRTEYEENKMEAFNSLSADLYDGLAAIKEIVEKQVPKGSRIRLADACICALESLKDIRMLTFTEPHKVSWKLEYELSAIIEAMAMQFYYWGIVDEHPEERERFREYLKETDAFRTNGLPENERKYSCELTIIVTGYNKLSYTKQCVQSVLNNMPDDITCELILYNHGSSDGTKEYFEGIMGAKTINIAVNGAVPGVVLKAITGHYYLSVSNDVIIGKNAIKNIYRCIKEHDRYGYVVPTTPNVSNLQTIPSDYATREEFESFAGKNNVYDEKRHEQRVRLCNPLCIYQTDIHTRLNLETYEERFCSKSWCVFPDDKASLWMRRNGYKNILAKDAYCHHFGSLTIREEFKEVQEEQRTYLEGRKDFLTRYGVDPWGTGFCHDCQLFAEWEIKPVDGACVLGINCGLGANSLKVKEILREKGATDVMLYNFVQEERFLQDLEGVSDRAFCFGSVSEITEKTGRNRFDYIIVDDNLHGCEPQNTVRELLNAGIIFGQLACRTEDGRWRIYVDRMNIR